MKAKPHIAASRNGYSRWAIDTREAHPALVGLAVRWAQAWNKRNGWTELKALPKAEIEQIFMRRPTK